ncbi:MarR family transcriptional regulator [Nocardiopsis composta]|uniref:DNA-binding MarR family transcriptional regulator n=1 Tax=Nocardiopsis composta TaxID=157465 RepID=A0A7W8QGW4_9ACTN|nr:MarR family transcriptional regulator [Nocardiopsis composta]MBB5430040.1 DNA-binding MarR family transcriptional regulator [Nocardiopsis composta]
MPAREVRMRGEERERLAEDLLDVWRAVPSDVVAALQGAEGTGLSMREFAALYLLAEIGRPTQRELAERIGRSDSAASRLVDRLARRGLVRREDDPDSRRSRRIAVTGRGEELLRGLERMRVEAQVRLVEELDAEERELVVRAVGLLGGAARRRAGLR